MIMVNSKQFERWVDSVHEEINVLSEACENMVMAVEQLSQACADLDDRVAKLEEKNV